MRDETKFGSFSTPRRTTVAPPEEAAVPPAGAPSGVLRVSRRRFLPAWNQSNLVRQLIFPSDKYEQFLQWQFLKQQASAEQISRAEQKARTFFEENESNRSKGKEDFLRRIAENKVRNDDSFAQYFCFPQSGALCYFFNTMLAVSLCLHDVDNIDFENNSDLFSLFYMTTPFKKIGTFSEEEGKKLFDSLIEKHFYEYIKDTGRSLIEAATKFCSTIEEASKETYHEALLELAGTVDKFTSEDLNEILTRELDFTDFGLVESLSKVFHQIFTERRILSKLVFTHEYFEEPLYVSTELDQYSNLKNQGILNTFILDKAEEKIANAENRKLFSCILGIQAKTTDPLKNTGHYVTCHFDLERAKKKSRRGEDHFQNFLWFDLDAKKAQYSKPLAGKPYLDHKTGILEMQDVTQMVVSEALFIYRDQ